MTSRRTSSAACSGSWSPQCGSLVADRGRSPAVRGSEREPWLSGTPGRPERDVAGLRSIAVRATTTAPPSNRNPWPCSVPPIVHSRHRSAQARLSAASAHGGAAQNARGQRALAGPRGPSDGCPWTIIRCMPRPLAGPPGRRPSGVSTRFLRRPWTTWGLPAPKTPSGRLGDHPTWLLSPRRRST